jgi:hypothetical protein
MPDESEFRILSLSIAQLKELRPVLSDKERRKEFAQQLRKQGVVTIFAADAGPVYEGGVKRQIMICHMLGYSTRSWMCDDVPSVDERKERCYEILRDLYTLTMEHGGVILTAYDLEPDDLDDDDEDSFDEYSMVECEFPTTEDAETASQLVLDMWAAFGVSVFDENGEMIANPEIPSSPYARELPSEPRTNKAPEKRVPSRLLRAYANLSSEREDILSRIASIHDVDDAADLEERKFAIKWWCGRRDIIFAMASVALHDSGLPLDPTREQLDEWLGGNKLHDIDS